MAIPVVGFDHVQVVDFSPHPASGSLFLITGVAKIEFRGSTTPDSDGWTRDTSLEAPILASGLITSRQPFQIQSMHSNNEK